MRGHLSTFRFCW